jgi:hypothetical protein
VEQSVPCELARAGAINPAGFLSHECRTAGFFGFWALINPRSMLKGCSGASFDAILAAK